MFALHPQPDGRNARTSGRVQFRIGIQFQIGGASARVAPLSLRRRQGSNPVGPVIRRSDLIEQLLDAAADAFRFRFFGNPHGLTRWTRQRPSDRRSDRIRNGLLHVTIRSCSGCFLPQRS